MTQYERCIITELLIEQCAHCKKLLTPEEEQAQDDKAIEQLAKRWFSNG